ncbi:hypothetical protein, partial [Coleofasciculus sp.]|uniref:hypothetical protein n=1 Tax=Coleofasciculus sp. TaxID=3100458 RepID=UPI003A122A1E
LGSSTPLSSPIFVAVKRLRTQAGRGNKTMTVKTIDPRLNVEILLELSVSSPTRISNSPIKNRLNVGS